MQTYSQIKGTFLQALIELKQLEGPDKVTQALRVMKERETGKLCYQAEEELTLAELSLLKDLLGARKSMWENYKQQCREGFSF